MRMNGNDVNNNNNNNDKFDQNELQQDVSPSSLSSSTPNGNIPTEQFAHKWTIRNIGKTYFQKMGYDSTNPHKSEMIFSEKFPSKNWLPNMLDVHFYLELIPNGEDTECDQYVSVFLYLSSCMKHEIMVHYRLCIIDMVGDFVNYEGNVCTEMPH